jgi:hypothetical protein
MGISEVSVATWSASAYVVSTFEAGQCSRRRYAVTIGEVRRYWDEVRPAGS